MKYDKTILSKTCVMDGEIGLNRPNDNVLAVGCSGVGKSLSLEYPTMLHLKNSSLLATFSKEVEGLKMASFKRKQGYKTVVCNLADPNQSDVFFEPLSTVSSYNDITELSTQIVKSVLEKTNDNYWNTAAIVLLESLIGMAMIVNEEPSIVDALDLFDKLNSNDMTEQSEVMEIYSDLRKIDPNCAPVRGFQSYLSLESSQKTLACVVDCLSAALRTVFPEDIRRAIRGKEQVDFLQLANEKTAVFIISSPTNKSLSPFVNLMYDAAIKQLLEYSQTFSDGKLPRKVKLFFDDFACSSRIDKFPEYISVFRAAGISAVMLLQSESQLEELYGSGNATTIINNCSTYVYFPGGMDYATSKSVSNRMNLPLEDVLYANVGNLFIMQSGKKPVIDDRYEILKDVKFKQMNKMKVQKER